MLLRKFPANRGKRRGVSKAIGCGSKKRKTPTLTLPRDLRSAVPGEWKSARCAGVIRVSLDIACLGLLGGQQLIEREFAAALWTARLC